VKGYLTNPDNAGECNDYNYNLYANNQTLTGDDTLTISWSGIRAWLDAYHPDSNPGGFGSYTFGFMADWGCDVGELDEYNNSATQAVTVVSPLDVVVFNIYRQDEAGGDFDSLTSVTSLTNYMDTGLVGEQVYGYKVNQVDARCCSIGYVSSRLWVISPQRGASGSGESDRYVQWLARRTHVG
jgi:hypothetical protein